MVKKQEMIKGLKMDYSKRFFYVIDGYVWRKPITKGRSVIAAKICDCVSSKTKAGGLN